jgi:hypothetical protein
MKFLMNAQNVLNMNNGSLHTPLEYHKGGDGGAGEARAREEARQLKIENKQYADHRTNVYDLNKTSLDKSYKDAQQNLTFNLARNGLGNSSISADKKTDLLTDYNDNIQKANDMSDNAMNSLKSSDERTRQNLVNSVQTGLDQTQAVSQALNNMQLNYDKASEVNVANNWDGMFKNWKSAQNNERYNRAMSEGEDGAYGQTYFVDKG